VQFLYSADASAIFPTKKKLTDKNDVDDDCHDSRGL
jgi:hypothetical protein